MKIGIISDSLLLGFAESVKKAASLGAQGIQKYMTYGDFAYAPVIAQVEEGSPAYEAGLQVEDRIVAVNMVGTNTIAIIAVLAVKLGESYLADIGLIYAMVSFLAVVLLTKVYMGAYREKKMREQQKEAEKP